MSNKITYISSGLVIAVVISAVYIFNSSPGNDVPATEEPTERRLINFNFNQESKEFQELMVQASQHYQNGNTKKALSTYVQAYEADKTSVAPFLAIAEIYIDTGKYDLAQENLILAQKKGPLPNEGKRLLARLQLLEKNYQQTREVLQSIKTPNNEDYLLEIVLSLLVDDIDNAREKVDLIAESNTEGTYKESGLLLQKAFELYDTFTDSPRSYLLVLAGEQLIEIEEYDLARPLLFEAISEENTYRDAWTLLGYSFLQSNKLTDAKQTLTKSKELDPYNATTHFYLGLTQEALGEQQLAITALSQAEGFDYPNKKEIYIHKANNYFALEDYKNAAAEYEKANDISTLDMDLYTRTVWMYIEPLNNSLKALNLAQKAVQNNPGNAMALNLLGWAQLANNNLNEAEKFLQQAISKDVTLDASYLNLGVLHASKENQEVANKYFEKAIKYATENGNKSIKARAESEQKKLTQNQDE